MIHVSAVTGRIRLAVVIVYILFSTALFGEAVVVYPPGPTTLTPVEIHYLSGCDPGAHTIAVTGNVIKVHFAGGGFCGDPPVTIGWKVTVPQLLEPGEYRVEVALGDTDDVKGTASFVVRNAHPNAPFEVHPFAVPGDVNDRTPVRLSGGTEHDPLCPQGTCRVLVGGVEVAKQIFPDGSLWITPPAHAPGMVDVEIRRQLADLVLKNGLYYFHKSAPANLSVFEPILFPTLTSIPGANGSLWQTEAAMFNPATWYVENYNEILPFQCIDYPCGERLLPDDRVSFEGGDYPHGVALLVPRNEAPELSFALRARDISRSAQDFGTEIPVVREHDMFFNQTMTMLDVPLEPSYRVKLRVYALPLQGLDRVYPGAVAIFRREVSSPEEERETWIDLPLARDCTALICAQTPYYAEYDVPAAAEGARVDVYVEPMPETMSWAFITVTNNETQQVTIVTPSPKGGQR